VIVVAESDTDEPSAFSHDRRSFQLKERVTSSDLSDPHVAAQLIERIGWALADAEDAERARHRQPAVTSGGWRARSSGASRSPERPPR
jgi:hypothetical protein